MLLPSGDARAGGVGVFFGEVGALDVFTVRKVFGMPGRLREVLNDLSSRGVIDAAEVEGDNPLAWIVESGDAKSVIEAAYRYAAYTDGVTAVMNGANVIELLEQNIANVLKGPLSPPVVDRLAKIFGKVAEAVGN